MNYTILQEYEWKNSFFCDKIQYTQKLECKDQQQHRTPTTPYSCLPIWNNASSILSAPTSRSTISAFSSINAFKTSVKYAVHQALPAAMFKLWLITMDNHAKF